MGERSKKELEHDRIVLEVWAEVSQDRQYSSVDCFVDYDNGQYTGEVDVLGRKGKMMDFYEIKCSRNRKSVRNAQRQFDRFKQSYPGRVGKGFLYTPTNGLERLF
jgi:hypothetical protein